MTVINTNIKALYAENALKSTAKDSLTATMQLATGKKINSSADDPAGMAIASRMTQNIKSLGQAIANAGNAMSLIQTVDSAADGITTMLQRMSELALQASNGSMSSDQRGYLDQEFQQLKLEISRTAATQEWNGFPVMNGKAGDAVGLPKYTTMDRPVATVATGSTAAAPAASLAYGDLSIVVDGKTYSIPATLASSNDPSSTAASMSNKAASAIAVATAINSQTASTGVTAVPNPAVIEGAKTTVRSTTLQANLYVNGEKIALNLPAGQTEAERRTYVMDSINATSSVHGVTAISTGTGGIKLSTPDGRNLSVWYDSTTATPPVTAADMGLGMDTLLPTDVPGVTGMDSGARLEATRETVALTFSAFTAAGQSVSVNGLTLTSSGAMTATQVAAAFANLTSGMTAAEATTANPTSAALGTFAGTFAAGFTTGSNSSATVTATATADNLGDVGSIVTSPIPTVATTAGVTGVTESSLMTFADLSSGQSVTVNGLTFTAGSSTVTAANVATAFASLTSGMTAAQALAAHSNSALGAYSGTFAAGFTTDAISGVTVTARSTTATANVTDITTTGVSTVVTTPGAGLTESSVITFSSLTPGQSITVNGLKFTATGNMTDAQVAAAYSSLTSGMSASQATTAHAAISLLGTYSGTFATGFTTGAITGATVTATSTTANSDVTNIAVSTGTTFPAAVPTDGLNVLASTVYGTVTLQSENSFTMIGSSDAIRTNLGFDNLEVKKQDIGRLSFQVGADSSQTVTVDIADFGKNGNITGAITSDSAATSITTVLGAQNVMNLMNTALNAVSAQRSNLGSLINRLQEISDNLTSVQTNETASRSQIEDADFAVASTAASKAQIMTQAATAVLAQANTDMQTVLKLLQ